MSLQFWSDLAADPNAPLWDRVIPGDSEVTLRDIQEKLARFLNDRDESLEDRVDDFLDWLDDNDIQFVRPQEMTRKIKGSKNDDVITPITWITEKIDGKKGDDLVRLGDEFWDSDLTIEGSKIILTDRWTGRETVLKSVERIEIGGHVYDVDTLKDALSGGGVPVMFSDGLARIKVNTTDPTPSVIWDQVVLSLVAETQPGPTNAACIYGMLHTAIYDAFAAHDAQATRVSIDPDGDNIEFRDAAPKLVEAAMHHAGYTVLSQLFPDHKAQLDTLMWGRLDLSPNDIDSPEAMIGRDAAHDVLRQRLEERAGLKVDYNPKNPNPDTVSLLDAWTPEYLGNHTGPEVQTFLTPEFSLLKPFALPLNAAGTTDFEAFRPPAPEAFFQEGFADAHLDIAARTITLASPGVVGGISYAAGHTIPVTRDLIGNVINPDFISQAQYLIDVSANLSPQDRAVAEFWEDGPGTSYPPGTMMTMAQFVSAGDEYDYATDAQLFLAMGNAMFDAAIAAWDAKVVYDYARPVQVIRDLGKLGLIGESGIDELTGEAGFVISAFGGYDPDTGEGLGTRTILADNFVTYQDPKGGYSPPFAEYVSGHSTFSGAAAAVLTSFSGDTTFGASTILPAGGSNFDPTFPTTSMMLSWADFETAAQEAGLSRIYGGIHFQDGNSAGLDLGETAGSLAVDLAEQFATGTVTDLDSGLADWMFG